MMNMAYPRKWLHTSSISQSNGAQLFRTIEQEVDRVNLLSSSLYNSKQLLLEQQQQQQQNGEESSNTAVVKKENTNGKKEQQQQHAKTTLELEASEYRAQLANIHGILGDAMMSAVHREIYHYHVNHSATLPPCSTTSKMNEEDNDSSSAPSTSSSSCSSSPPISDSEECGDKQQQRKSTRRRKSNNNNSNSLLSWRSKKHRHHDYPQSTSALIYNLKIANDEDESYMVQDLSGGDTDDDEEDEEDQENMMNATSEEMLHDSNSQDHHQQKQLQHQKNHKLTTDDNNNNNQTSSSSQKGKSNNNNNNTSSSANNTSNNSNNNGVDQKVKRREEAKKKRQEDEDLLKMKKVKTEKSNLLTTLGPFPIPRTTVRSLKSGTPVPSRKNLTQRLNLEHLESSSSSTDEEEREILIRLAATPYSNNNSNSNTTNDASSSSTTNNSNNANDDDEKNNNNNKNNNENAMTSSSSSSSSSSPVFVDEQEIVKRLIKFLSPLSLDSLKKIGESAKMKLKGGISHEDAVNEIARTSIKLGCEKVCILMDKTKLLEKIAMQQNTSKTHILAQFATNVPSFLGVLKPESCRLLAPALGIPADTVTVLELWERFVAMGLGGVLAHLRPRPLKKIGQEISVAINENLSTEKQCDQIVYALFPRERLRVRYAKKIRRAPGVSFAVTPGKTRCLEDMGYIGFTIHNVSQMRNDQGERHYSPEFEFGNLRWSLLCMCNKEALALYLCQQGSVHCKFVISVVNHNNPEDAVYNEGTQEFKQTSSENDWGFNNVIKFDQLLDPKSGFWKSDGDIIQVELGIVLVSEVNNNNNKEASGAATGAAVGTNNNNEATMNKKKAATGFANNNKSKEQEELHQTLILGNNNNNKKDQQQNGNKNQNNNKENKKQQHSDPQKDAAEVAQQLLETERIEALRRRIKQQFTKLHSEEEKVRKDIINKNNQDFQRLIIEQAKKDEQRIAKEAAEREKREQQERQREQEKLRLLQEQHQELRKKLSDLTEENADIANKKKAIASEISEVKSNVEAKKKEFTAADKSLEETRSRVDEIRQRLEERRNRLAALRAKVEALPSIQETTTQELAEDNEILKSVQQSLAGIIDF